MVADISCMDWMWWRCSVACRVWSRDSEKLMLADHNKLRYLLESFWEAAMMHRHASNANLWIANSSSDGIVGEAARGLLRCYMSGLFEWRLLLSLQARSSTRNMSMEILLIEAPRTKAKINRSWGSVTIDCILSSHKPNGCVQWRWCEEECHQENDGAFLVEVERAMISWQHRHDGRSMMTLRESPCYSAVRTRERKRYLGDLFCFTALLLPRVLNHYGKRY